MQVDMQDTGDIGYYSHYDEVLAGESSPIFDSFGPESSDPQDIQPASLSYYVHLEDGSEQSVRYDFELGEYDVRIIEQ